MKKFYLILATVFFATTAFAGNLTNLKHFRDSKHPKIETGAPSENLGGVWTFYYGDYFFYASAMDEITCSYVAEYFEEDGEAFWIFSSEEGMPLFLEETKVAGSLNLGAYFITSFEFEDEGVTYYLSQEPFIFSQIDEKGYEWLEEVSFTYDSATGVMTPAIDEGYKLGIEWGFWSTTKEPEYLGSLDMVFFYKAVKEGVDNGGVEGFEADETEPIYYNLQGQIVENPSNGLFIKKQGKKSMKVMLK